MTIGELAGWAALVLSVLVGILLAAHHGLEFEGLVLPFGLDQRRLELCFERCLLLGQLGHGLKVGGGPGQLLVRLDQGVGDFQLLDDAAGRLLVGPEAGVGLLGFELIADRDFPGDVKESPAAGPAGRTGRRSAAGDPGSS